MHKHEIISTGAGYKVLNDGVETTVINQDGTLNGGSVIDDGSITLAKLATVVAPSYVIKYAGEITWTGSGASLATTVTGALATDIVVATIQSAPTEAASMVSCAVTNDTITTTLSAANTSNDAVISYQVLRATA